MNRRVYKFDYESREFIGSYLLGPEDIDPSDPTSFLMPGDVTFAEPPPIGPDQRAIWLVDHWQVVGRPNEEKLAEIKLLAQTLLQQSDRVAVQCFKFCLTYPQDWKDFDAAAMSILMKETWEDGLALPAYPPLPWGDR